MYKFLPNRRVWLLSAPTLIAALLTISLVLPAAQAPVSAQGTELAEAVVLVNSNSSRYTDFAQLIQPYLDHFGVPYTVLDVASTPVTAAIGDYALIIIGHRQMDPSYVDLDLAEQQLILNAVNAGSGLVNFDGELADAGVGLYIYVQGIFSFGYHVPGTDYGVTFPPVSGDTSITIDCTDDANQNPVLATEPVSATINTTDGEWTEMLYAPRPVAGLFAGLDEETSGLPVMHCFASGLPNGDYEVRANLFTGVFGQDLTYYYSYTSGNPKQFSVDTVGRSGGEDRFDEYNLGTVTVSDGSFHIYFQDADERTIPGPAASRASLEELYALDPHVPDAVLPYFGWSSVRLVPVGAPAPTMHWISALHEPTEWIGTGNMPMSGIATMAPSASVVAQSRSEALLIAGTAGQGRGVQWASYDWMSYGVKGPMYGLDDLVWRSLVWAARKPFVMQGMPPFITMRVDDSDGPYGWIEAANSVGIKPWAGLFYQQIDVLSSTQLSNLTNAGNATAAVHAKNQDVEATGVFYYNHGTGDLPDETVTLNFADAQAWFAARDIPMSKFVVPQFYEFGTNVFDDLATWGVESVGTVIDPGTAYGSPWINLGPFRLLANGNSDSGDPLYYADFMELPAPYQNQFFNCLTEIRDDASYEWYPNNDVAASIGRGTRQLKRALDAMAIPTLVTHEPYLETVTPANLTTILQGITGNLASYGLIGVTMDEACQYARAVHTSEIGAAQYNPVAGDLTIDFAGQSDVPTMLYLFTGQPGAVQQTMVDVPAFTGSAQVVVPIQASVLVYLPLVRR